MTDARGFTWRFDRNELGEIYRAICPQPYNFLVENFFDADRNTVRVDTQDMQPAFDSADPTSARFAQFTPSGSGNTAHVAMQPGPGGSVRPGWFTNLYTFDILDKKTQGDIDATGSTPANLVTTFLRDANENIVLITKPQGNIVEIDFDERDFQIAARVGRDAASDEPGAVTVIARDGNGNLLQIIAPAPNGASSGEIVSVMIDDAFRGAALQTFMGVSAVLNTIDGFDRVIQATDPLGNFVDTGAGYTSGNPFLDPDGRIIRRDSYGTRGDGTTDIVKLASVQMRFDEGGRRYEAQRNVFVASGTTLNSTGRTITHDPTGCLQTNSITPRGGPAVQIYPLSGAEPTYVLTRNVFDPGARIVVALADNSQPTSLSYDGADRQTGVLDALGNAVANTFDPAGNLVVAVRTEKCTIAATPALPTESFAAAAYYDCLNQMVLQAAQGADGNLNSNIIGLTGSASFWDMAPWNVASSTLVSCQAFDSRGNPVLSIDPKGNSAVTIFDGASRAVQFQQHLRQQGQGQNPPAPGQTLLPGGGAVVSTAIILDGNSRRTQLIDDRGNATRWEFDTLDREIKMIFHDGSTRTSQYDEASDVITYTDENGSVFTNLFDALGRKYSSSIVPNTAVGVSTTTVLQTFAFDGLSRMTNGHNEGLSGSDPSDVNLFYDSIDRVLEDSQSFAGNTRDVTNTAFKSYPVTQFQFPGTSGRKVDNAFDALYRRVAVKEDSTGDNIASWSFFGPSRVAQVTLGSGLLCTMMNGLNSAVQPGVPNPPWGDATTGRLGYDGAARMISKRYLCFGFVVPFQMVAAFTTAFDRASNKLYERALHAEERSHLYEPYDSNQIPQGGYDSLDRLLQYQRGTLSATGGDGGNGGGSIVTGEAIELSGTNSQRSYLLDSVGNWRNTQFTPATTGTPTQTTEIRQHNGLNEITRYKRGSSAPVILAYDGVPGASNGNLTFDGTLTYQWDALNRLAVAMSGDSPVGSYYYDALNRRIRKMVGSTTTDFIYSGWRCLEDRNPFGGEGGSTDTPLVQYVWGRYLDELLQITTLVPIATGSGETARTDEAGTYYTVQDLLYRTTATVMLSPDGTEAAIVEAYDFDAYGNTLIFNNYDTDYNWWGDDAVQVSNSLCQFLFTGQRFDSETGLYYYKRRMYAAVLGRFLSRDPLDYSAGGMNLYAYGDGNPATLSDPTGEGAAPGSGLPGHKPCRPPPATPPTQGPVSNQALVGFVVTEPTVCEQIASGASALGRAVTARVARSWGRRNLHLRHPGCDALPGPHANRHKSSAGGATNHVCAC